MLPAGSLTWLKSITQDLVYGFDILVRRRVKHDDNGTQETDGTAELSEGSQFFL